MSSKKSLQEHARDAERDADKGERNPPYFGAFRTKSDEAAYKEYNRVYDRAQGKKR